MKHKQQVTIQVAVLILKTKNIINNKHVPIPTICFNCTFRIILL